MSANIEHARKQFNTLIDMMNSNGLKFTKNEDNLSISSGFITEDIPVEYFIQIDAEREIAVFMSKLPFTMPEEKRVDGAIAVCVANNRGAIGAFDYDIASGEIYYKMAVPFCGGVNLSQEVFHMLTFVGTSTINAYNDKLYLISQGMMTVSDLIKQNNN